MSEEEQAVYDAAKNLVAMWKSNGYPGGDLPTAGYPPRDIRAKALIAAVEAAIAAEE